ncbi:MAG TPA: SDR family oxidoreductase [Bacilli bacterium]
MDLGLKDKVFLVSASSKGLGAAIAEGLAAEGANLALCSRSQERIGEFARQLADKYGVSVLPHQADVSRSADTYALVQNTLKHFGRLDGLVCNAGGPRGGSFLELADSDWEAAFQTNVMSVVRLIRECHPYLRESKGKIVTVASTSAKVPIPGLVLSNVMRSGVLGLMKSLAEEFAADGILLNTVCPGKILTDRIRELNAFKAKSIGTSVADVEKEAIREIPLGRYGKPQEFANFAVFLLSERNTYVTGSTFMVDGGMVKSL